MLRCWPFHLLWEDAIRQGTIGEEFFFSFVRNHADQQIRIVFADEGAVV